MKLSFDLQTEIESRILSIFGSNVDTKELQIVISNSYPESHYILFSNWTCRKAGSPIEGFLAEYKLDEEKIIVFLPILSHTSNLSTLNFEYLIRVTIYYEIGLWICYSSSYGGKSFLKKEYNATGNIFRNFTALMIAYELLKYDSHLVWCFENLVSSLHDDYTLCLRFIRIIKDGKVYLPGLIIEDVMKLIKSVINSEDEKISRDYLMDYFDDYITRCIREDPRAVNHFRDLMTDKQKDKWKHNSIEFDFHE